MTLPDFPDISAQTLALIAARHGLAARTFAQVPSTGIFNVVYLMGDDLILRVPRNHPHFAAAISKEAVAVPAARLAGVRTPRLIAFDDSLALLPVPYAIYERVYGEALFELEPAAGSEIYRELGRDLAQLHTGVKADSPAGVLGAPNLPLDDPRALPDELAHAGYFSSGEAHWLAQWLERLPPLLTAAHDQRFLHGDTQTTNLLVRREPLTYLALIDWGGCGWGDPALDFSGMPLGAVPYVLRGYREYAALPDDQTAEARILRYHLHFALINLRNQPQPQRSWGERPLSYLLAIMRALLEDPQGTWATRHL